MLLSTLTFYPLVDFSGLRIPVPQMKLRLEQWRSLCHLAQHFRLNYNNQVFYSTVSSNQHILHKPV